MTNTAAADTFTFKVELEGIPLWSNTEHYAAYIEAKGLNERDIDALDFDALHELVQKVDTTFVGFAATYEELAQQFEDDFDGARIPTEENLIQAQGFWFHR